MVEKYIIPKTIDEFLPGTEYQILSVDNIWQSNKIVNHLCFSLKNYLSALIELKRVRIVYYE